MSNEGNSIAPLNSVSPYFMTSEILEEREKRTDIGRVYGQLYLGLITLLTSMSFGVILNRVSPKTDLKTGEEHLIYTSLEGSLILLGCAFGVLVGGGLVYSLGPKCSQLFFTPFLILMWLLDFFFTKATVFNFFLGLIGEMYMIAAIILIEDAIHKKLIRYFWGVLSSTVYLGMLLDHLLNLLLPKFIIVSLLCSIPTIQFVMLIFLPESPVFLYQKSERKAIKSLIWYRGKKSIYMDIRRIRREYEMYRVDAIFVRKMLYKTVILKAIGIILGLIILKAWSSYYLILFYHVNCFNGHTFFSKIIDSSLIKGWFFISRFTIVIIQGSQNWQLKISLLVSVITLLFILILYTVILCLFYYSILFELSIAPLIFCLILITSQDIGLNYVPEYLLIEYVPCQVLHRAIYIVDTIFWLIMFALIKSYDYLKDLPLYIQFSSFGAFMFFGVIYCALVVINPHNKSLTQVQLKIGGMPIGRRSFISNFSQNEFHSTEA